MGGACSAAKIDDTNEIIVDVESQKTRDPSQTFSHVIQDYQQKNEKLRQELDQLKTKKEEGVIEREEKARQNEEVIKELAEMKENLELKYIALTKGRLETALRCKVSTMCETEPTTKLCIKGNLKKCYNRMGLSKSKKDKWVEVYVYEGKLMSTGFKAGYVMLEYSDYKDAQIVHRYHISQVFSDDSQSKEVFSLKVFNESSEKELIFMCQNVDEKNEWVRKIRVAFDEVRSEWTSMHETFTVTIEFTKESIGLKVEERVIDNYEGEEKIIERAENYIDKIEIVDKNPLGHEEISQGGKLEYQHTVFNSPAVPYESGNLDMQQEEPCKLIVSEILDDDLSAAGLEVNCVMTAINDIRLVGLTYTKQINLVKTTPKPFKITFTGEKFLKKKPVLEHGYQSILKELVADGDNAVKKAFQELIKGTLFETELNKSSNQANTITALLTDQRKLMALLQNLTVQEMEL
jgi:hypothetical protein